MQSWSQLQIAPIKGVLKVQIEWTKPFRSNSFNSCFATSTVSVSIDDSNSGQYLIVSEGSTLNSKQYRAFFLPAVTLLQTQGMRVIDCVISTIPNASSKGTT